VEVVVSGGDGGERRGRTVPVGGENGDGEEKGGKERVFGDSDGGERIWWRENEVPAPVPVDGESGCRWRESGGGGRMGLGGNEIVGLVFDLCFFFFFFLKKKKSRNVKDRRGICHITFVITVESRTDERCKNITTRVQKHA
jgi:hypothetical protein